LRNPDELAIQAEDANCVTHPKPGNRALFSVAAALLLLFLFICGGGAALRESVTFDEVAHIGAGVSYLQRLDLRLNEEHPPLPKALAALPLVLLGTRADYSHISWTISESFFPAFLGEWVFGHWLLMTWNDPVSTLAWARLAMLLLTLALGWALFACGSRLGGPWGGLLCLAIFVSTPAFLTFGPLVLTDVPIALFSLLALWTFAEIWRDPNPRNVRLFALSLAGALLSKFTAGLLFVALPVFAVSTRWFSLPGQPQTKPEASIWRLRRTKALWKGILYAALVVYAVYFVLSWNQPVAELGYLGHSAAWAPVRRMLMPPWLYLRGLFLFAVMAGTRPTFLLGHAYSHGVWFYYPALVALKSSLAFLGLLALAAGLGVAARRRRSQEARGAISAGYEIHWRVMWVSLIVYTAVLMLSHFDISIRHFTIPLALLILMLAPLPRLAWRTQALTALTAALAAGCLFTAVHAYPNYMPYFNALRMGRPAYELASDSNVDWNQALPEARRFAERHGQQVIELDEYATSDPAAIFPQARIWDCQTPGPSDAGQWVLLSANMILDAHDCGWLMRYPHEELSNGSMYAVKLPAVIPPAGADGGPPLPDARRIFLGGPIGFDMRTMFLGVIRHPETILEVMAKMQADYTKANGNGAPEGAGKK
jgi:Dolichyl-phosphate-mannose-protein mannosyltransferase